MQERKKHLSKLQKTLITIVTVLAVGAVALFVLEKTHVTNFIQVNPTNSDDQAAQKAAQQKKQDFIEKQDASTDTPAEIPKSRDTITLTASQENTTVTVLTKLAGYAGGTCELRIVNGTKTTSKTAEIIYQPEFSSCAGFSIPASELGSGNWQITLTATPSGGAALSKSTSLEVQ